MSLATRVQRFAVGATIAAAAGVAAPTRITALIAPAIAGAAVKGAYLVRDYTRGGEPR